MQVDKVISLDAGMPAEANSPIIVGHGGIGIPLGAQISIPSTDVDSTNNIFRNLGYPLPTGIKVKTPVTVNGLTKDTTYYVINKGNDFQLAANLRRATGYNSTNGLTGNIQVQAINASNPVTFTIVGSKDNIIGTSVHDVDPSECGQPFSVLTGASRSFVPYQIEANPDTSGPGGTAVAGSAMIRFAGSAVYAHNDEGFYSATPTAGRLMGFLAHDVSNTDNSSARIDIVTIIS